MVSMSDPLLGLDGVREVVSSYFHMAPIVAEATVFGQRPNRPRCSCFLPEETPSRSVPSPKEYTSVPPRYDPQRISNHDHANMVKSNCKAEVS